MGKTRIILPIENLASGRLPQICACCGETAVTTKVCRMRYLYDTSRYGPDRVMYKYKVYKFKLPFCDRHRNRIDEWSLVSILLVVAAVVCGVLGALATNFQLGAWLAGLMMMLSAACGVTGMLALMISGKFMPHVSYADRDEFDETGLVELAAVSPEFVQACEPIRAALKSTTSYESVARASKFARVSSMAGIAFFAIIALVMISRSLFRMNARPPVGRAPNAPAAVQPNLPNAHAPVAAQKVGRPQDGAVPPSIRRPVQSASDALENLQNGETWAVQSALHWLAFHKPDANDVAVRSEIALTLDGLVLTADAQLRSLVMRSLAEWGTAANTSTLIELSTQVSGSERDQVLDALAATKDPRAVPLTTEGLFGADFFRHSAAIRRVKRMGPIAEQAVWQGLQHPEWMSRKQACELLGEIGTERSVPVLQDSQRDEQRFVQEAAQKAIASIETAGRSDQSPDVVGSPMVRVWTDSTGEHKVHAEFVGLAGDQVQLKRTEDGVVMTLKLDQLSRVDQQVARELAAGP